MNNNFITDKFSISKRRVSDEGFLIVEDSPFAKTGVLEYNHLELSISGVPAGVTLDPAKPIRVFRDGGQLFDEKTLKSFRSKPITLQHPENFVDSGSFRDTAVGFTKDDVVRDGDFMKGSLVIMDKGAIIKINSGIEELSLGYTANIDYAPGVTKDNITFDAVMSNIRGNHIAIVSRGRCGTDCKIADQKQKLKETKGNKMENTVVLDGVSYECPSQTAQVVIKSVKTLQDEKASCVQTHNKEVKTLREETKKATDTLQAQLDDAKGKILDTEAINKLVEERTKVIADARRLVENIDTKGMDTEQIKAFVVKSVCKIEVADEDLGYIDGRFDALCETKKEGTESYRASLKDASASVDEDTFVPLSQRKRQERINNNRKHLTKWSK